MDLIGRSPINPFLFYSGKISGYFTWFIFALEHTDNYSLGFQEVQLELLNYLSYALSGLALILVVISLIDLGKSTRLGLPKTETKLKVNGIYNFSRNPMYLGFDLLTLSSMIYTMNFWIIGLGMYSIFVYHQITKAEEKFLENRFGEDYAKYKSATPRYI